MSPSSTSSSEGLTARAPLAVDLNRGEAVATSSPLALLRPAQRWSARIVTTFFLAVVFGCGLVDTFWPAPAPKLHGSEKEQQEQRSANARFSDGSLAKLLEENMKLTSRVRRTCNALYAPMLLRVFDEAGQSLVAGPNHYLFRRERIAVAKPRDEILGLATGRFHAIDRRLEQLGVRFVAVPLPRKEAVMAIELPRGVEAHADYDSMLATSLRAAGVDFVDLLPAYLSPTQEPVYPAADSHWSAHGALLAAQQIAQHVVGPTESIATPSMHSSVQDTSHVFAYALGLDPMSHALLPTSPVLQMALADRTAAKTVSQPPATDPLPILLSGTSFSKHQNDQSTFFAEALSAILGRSLWNGARAGVTGLQSLELCLNAIEDRQLPSVVIMEQPNHYSLCFDSPLAEVGNLVARMPVPDSLQSLQHQDPSKFGLPSFGASASLKPGRHVLTPTNPLLARIPWDSFVYPRDGTISIRMSARNTDESIMVSVDHGPSKVVTRWPTGREVAVFPVAGDRLGQRFDVAAWASRGAQTFELESVEIVCDLDVAGGRAGIPSAVEVLSPDHWRQSIRFSGTATPDACVGIMTQGTPGPLYQREVKATFADGSSTRILAPIELHPTAQMLLPLGPDNRQLMRIDIEGRGPRPIGPCRAFWLPRARH